jgi:hypothetical protein
LLFFAGNGSTVSLPRNRNAGAGRKVSSTRPGRKALAPRQAANSLREVAAASLAANRLQEVVAARLAANGLREVVVAARLMNLRLRDAVLAVSPLGPATWAAIGPVS